MSKPTILITGCSSGIGKHCAHQLHESGWHVVASCRKQSDVEQIRALGIDSLVLDYEDNQTIETAFKQILTLFNGKIDAVFNNGAYAIPSLVQDLPTDALRQIFEANFFGWHHLNRLIIQQMLSQPTGKHGLKGRIVQNSSVLGFTGAKFRGAYCASKYALEGLSDVMRIELAPQAIAVSLIEPGPVTSQIRQNSIAHFKRWINWEISTQHKNYETELFPRLYAKGKVQKDRWELEPEAVTKKLIHALESTRPKPRYYVTTPTYIAGYMKRILSTRGYDRLTKGA